MGKQAGNAHCQKSPSAALWRLQLSTEGWTRNVMAMTINKVRPLVGQRMAGVSKLPSRVMSPVALLPRRGSALVSKCRPRREGPIWVVVKKQPERRWWWWKPAIKMLSPMTSSTTSVPELDLDRKPVARRSRSDWFGGWRMARNLPVACQSDGCASVQQSKIMEKTNLLVLIFIERSRSCHAV